MTDACVRERATTLQDGTEPLVPPVQPSANGGMPGDKATAGGANPQVGDHISSQVLLH